MSLNAPAISAAEYLPRNADGSTNLSLPMLRDAVQSCQGCDLYKDATQAVFGEVEGVVGEIPKQVNVVMVGEQPGDKEDLAGHPFVGPAGQLLNRALVDAGIDRKTVYITNAVKHFKWEPRGKWRIHKKPTVREVTACKPWLEAELAALRPRLIVCLGATAAQSLLGSAFKVTQHRGEVVAHDVFGPIIATVHPSSILRAATDEDRDREMKLFVEDLTIVAGHLQSGLESLAVTREQQRSLF